METRLPLRPPGPTPARRDASALRRAFYRRILRDHITGERLRRSEVCRRARLHENTLKRYLAGLVHPRFENGLRLAAALRMDPYELNRELRWVARQPWRGAMMRRQDVLRLKGKGVWQRLSWQRAKAEAEEFEKGGE